MRLTTRQRLYFRIALHVLGWQGTALALLLVLAWLLGVVMSDRTRLTQMLLWIPTPALLIAVVLGLLCSLAPSRRPWRTRRRVWLWGLVLLAGGAWFGLFEHRMLRGPVDDPEGLRIVHWTLTPHRLEDDRRRVAGLAIDMLGDVTVLTDSWSIRRILGEELDESMQVIPVGRFTFVTALPIVEKRAMVMASDMDASLLVVDARAIVGREVTIIAVDLPSSPTRSRMEIARKMQRLLAESEAPMPDVAVGDFNITRGSAALAQIWPAMHHAFDDGGHGYGATYHRAFPLYHIDHLLVSRAWRAVRYDLRDPGEGRHMAQGAWIIPTDE
jgi:hypothetical protein